MLYLALCQHFFISTFIVQEQRSKNKVTRLLREICSSPILLQQINKTTCCLLNNRSGMTACANMSIITSTTELLCLLLIDFHIESIITHHLSVHVFRKAFIRLEQIITFIVVPTSWFRIWQMWCEKRWREEVHKMFFFIHRLHRSMVNSYSNSVVGVFLGGLRFSWVSHNSHGRYVESGQSHQDTGILHRPV